MPLCKSPTGISVRVPLTLTVRTFAPSKLKSSMVVPCVAGVVNSITIKFTAGFGYILATGNSFSLTLNTALASYFTTTEALSFGFAASKRYNG